MKDYFIAGYTIAGLVTIWCGIGYFFARFSEWGPLSERFPESQEPIRKRHRFQSFRIEWSKYKNCIRFSLGSRGLHINVYSFFLVGHRPILIPWADMKKVEKGFLTTRITIGSGKTMKELTVPTGVIESAESFGYMTK